jgi:tetratricopeptide (TPR) repeat protein
MLYAAMLCCAMLGDQKTPAAAPPSDLAGYEAAKKEAGRDADSQVRLALWCEAHGLSAERVKHLGLAVLADPANALARGLSGLVEYQGKWKHPDEISKAVQDDLERKGRIQEYLQRRAKMPERAEDHQKLALWCEQNGLNDQAIAHFHQAIRLDPSREVAWKHLGYKKVGSRWQKPELVVAAKAEAQEQQKANRHWKPVLEKLRSNLKSKDKTKREEAEQALARITDRRAVPMVWATIGMGDSAQQKVAVQVLGQIDDASASRALVMLAVFGGSADVRRRATESLRVRDAREFAGMLIAMIQQPIEYKVKPVAGPGQGGELLIKGQGSAANLKRLYSPPAGPSIPPQPGDRMVLDDNGFPVIARPEPLWQTPLLSMNQVLATRPLPPLTAQQQSQLTSMAASSGLGAQGQKVAGAMMQLFNNQVSNAAMMTSLTFGAWALSTTSTFGPVTPATQFSFTIGEVYQIPIGRMAFEAQKSAATAQQQLQNDVDAINQYNHSLGEINNRVLPVLNEVSGLALGPNALAWQKWFVDLLGFRLNQLQASANPTIVEEVPLAYQPQPVPISSFVAPIGVTRFSCFGAGTLVRTLTGLEPIESLKVADQVLTQSTKTGALSYRPILAVHHNPPSKTFRLKLGGETIVSSTFHRFWKPGTGWVMARDLKEGDPIRTLNGTINVAAIEDGKTLPVYNLDVAEDADFFVGRTGVLAHDNTMPNLREMPFDAPTGVAKRAKAGDESPPYTEREQD